MDHRYQFGNPMNFSEAEGMDQTRLVVVHVTDECLPTPRVGPIASFANTDARPLGVEPLSTGHAIHIA